MIRRLYRHRRRVLLLMLAVTVAGFVSVLGDHDLRYLLKHQFPGPVWITVVSAVLTVVIMTLAVAAPILILFPGIRRTIEVFALTLLVLAGLFPVLPSLPDWAQTGAGKWMAFIAIYFGIGLLLDTDVLWRLGLRLPYRAKASRIIAAPPEAIWAAVATDAETTGTYWTHTLLRVDPRPDIGENVVEVRYRAGPSGTIIQRQTRLVWDKPLHLVYALEPEHAPEGSPAIKGTFEMRCEPLADGRTRVSVCHDYPALSFGTATLVWFDDLVACELDAISAHVMGRRDWTVTGWAARKMAA